MADKDEILTQFSTVTGVDQERARFHLEAAAWNLEVAMANFYEDHEDEDEGSAANPLDVDDMEEGEGEPDPQAQPIHKKKATKQKKNSRFGTIDSLRADEDSSSEEEGQAFYAGGSERSGQQVLGPKKKNNESMVTDLFQSAREHGAEEVGPSAAPASASGSFAFHGTGYRLGETEGPLESVAGPSVGGGPRRQVDMVLKMWKKGFSIDSGELRTYDDPVNKEFLDSIRRGDVPQELIRQAKGGEVNLNMEDHRTEDFVKSKVNLKAFSGEGFTLGSPAPAVVTPESSGASAAPEVNVDTSKPVTTLQIRLADGKRIVAKFNLSHTVADIRNHIVASYGQYATVTFVLMTTFPNKELTEEDQTLEEAKLANAVIVQRLK